MENTIFPVVSQRASDMVLIENGGFVKQIQPFVTYTG
jgi:hypothetical protein